jgi:hypothetical protein
MEQLPYCVAQLPQRGAPAVVAYLSSLQLAYVALVTLRRRNMALRYRLRLGAFVLWDTSHDTAVDLFDEQHALAIMQARSAGHVEAQL